PATRCGWHSLAGMPALPMLCTGTEVGVGCLTDMENRLAFRFQVPAPPAGPVVELSVEETEKLLLRKLAAAKDDPTAVLWQLAHFYKVVRQHEKALERLRQLMKLLPGLKQKAECVLMMGQAMEQAGDTH